MILMAFDAYYSTGNKNSAGMIINNEQTIIADPFNNTGLRGTPKIDYFNIGYVKWTGFNALVEYSNDSNFSAVLQTWIIKPKISKRGRI